MRAHAALSEAIRAAAPSGLLKRVLGLGLTEAASEVMQWQKKYIGELNSFADERGKKNEEYAAAVDRAFDDFYGLLFGLAGHGREWVPWKNAVGVDHQARLKALESLISEAVQVAYGRERFSNELFDSIKDVFNKDYKRIGALAGRRAGSEQLFSKVEETVKDNPLLQVRALFAMVDEAIVEGDRRTEYITRLNKSNDELQKQLDGLRAEKEAWEKSALVGLDDAPEGYRGAVSVTNTLHFSFLERLRVAFGRPHTVTMEVYLEWKPGATEGGAVYGSVAPLIRWPWNKCDGDLQVSMGGCEVE